MYICWDTQTRFSKKLSPSMIIISEGFHPYCEYKASFYKISYDARGKKKILFFTLSYGMFESHLFYGWIETISCCSFLKTNLICTLGNKNQQNIFLLTFNSTKVKPEKNRVVKWHCNARKTVTLWIFVFRDSIPDDTIFQRPHPSA